MTVVDVMQERLKNEISERRFIHSVNTMVMAKTLAKKYGADQELCMIAGLLHDCAKKITGNHAIEMAKQHDLPLDDIILKDTSLLHAPLGAIVAKEVYGVKDRTVLDAIANHTMGREGMSIIEKIVFLSDYIEPHRFFTGVEELRDVAMMNLDAAIILAIDGTIRRILSMHKPIHPNTIKTRNYYIDKREGESHPTLG